LVAGSNQFNTKPSKGIAFLQEQELLSNFTSEIASFLHENHLLDKGMIGEYLGDRKNADILDHFIMLVPPAYATKILRGKIFHS